MRAKFLQVLNLCDCLLTAICSCLFAGNVANVFLIKTFEGAQFYRYQPYKEGTSNYIVTYTFNIFLVIRYCLTMTKITN